MVDRYTKAVLTLIACALIYLCVIFTPLPRAHAQTPSKHPGEPSGPTEVIVVGWRAPGEIAVPVTITHPVQVTAPQALRVTGEVRTQQSANVADRVVLVGWEENAGRERVGSMQQLDDNPVDAAFRGLPVRMPR